MTRECACSLYAFTHWEYFEVRSRAGQCDSGKAMDRRRLANRPESQWGLHRVHSSHDSVRMGNDGIREGWLPIAAVGFVVTCFGALALARFEGAPSRHA